MIYDIRINGTSIWNSQPTYRLINPVVEIELNTAGRLKFTMPPNHPYFDAILPMQDTVEVFENGDLIWFGRPTELERNLKNYKSCYCEGALAFFNDSVQRPREAANVTADAIFRDIISVHNAQVSSNRQFSVGSVTMPQTLFGWENSYCETMSAITELLKRAGGYIIPRRSGGSNVLDYISELPTSNAQPVEFGLNMLDFDRRYSLSDIATCALPLGAVPAGGSSPITIADVNGGDDILETDRADRMTAFGKIVKLLKFDNVSDKTELKERAQAYLDGIQFDPITIELSAAELSLLDSQYGPFKIGTVVHASSTPHWLDRDLPIIKMSIPMDRAAKQITIGTVPVRTMTEKILEEVEKEDEKIESVKSEVYSGKWGGGGACCKKSKEFDFGNLVNGSVMETLINNENVEYIVDSDLQNGFPISVEDEFGNVLELKW